MESPAQQSPSAKRRTMVQLRFVLWPIVILIVGFLVLGILSNSAEKPQKKPIEIKSPLVEVMTLTPQTVSFEVPSQGNVQPRTETVLVTEVAGTVKKVSEKFVTGGFFKQGETLLEIEPINYEVALLQAQAALDGMRAKLSEEQARADQAEKDWLMTGKSLQQAPALALRKPQLQQALANVKAAEADVENAKIKLANTVIRAPYTALLKTKMVDVGQYVTMGAQLARVFAIDTAEVRLPIKEQDLAFLKNNALAGLNDEGVSVNLQVNQHGQLSNWTAKLTRSEGVVDTQSRVEYMVAQIEDPYRLLSQHAQGPALKVGTYVTAAIQGKSANNMLVVPRSALHSGNKIYTLTTENTLAIHQVDIVYGNKESVFIAAESLPIRQVVLTNISTPVEGMALRVKTDDSATVGTQAGE